MRTTFRSRPTTRFVRHELPAALCLSVARPTSPVNTDGIMKRALPERFRLIVVDEAQWPNRECFEYSRHVHDDVATMFALLFVSGAGCYEALSREPCSTHGGTHTCSSRRSSAGSGCARCGCSAAHAIAGWNALGDLADATPVGSTS